MSNDEADRRRGRRTLARAALVTLRERAHVLEAQWRKTGSLTPQAGADKRYARWVFGLGETLRKRPGGIRSQWLLQNFPDLHAAVLAWSSPDKREGAPNRGRQLYRLCEAFDFMLTFRRAPSQGAASAEEKSLAKWLSRGARDSFVDPSFGAVLSAVREIAKSLRRVASEESRVVILSGPQVRASYRQIEELWPVMGHMGGSSDEGAGRIPAEWPSGLLLRRFWQKPRWFARRGLMR